MPPAKGETATREMRLMRTPFYADEDVTTTDANGKPARTKVQVHKPERDTWTVEQIAPDSARGSVTWQQVGKLDGSTNSGNLPPDVVHRLLRLLT